MEMNIAQLKAFLANVERLALALEASVEVSEEIRDNLAELNVRVRQMNGEDIRWTGDK